MKIDWFTFVAQIINFLILLALLKRFLYGPILKAIADRETEIASRFDHVRSQHEAAEQSRRKYEARTEQLTHAKQQLLAEAAAEVERWKLERLTEARTELEESRVDWFVALDRERDQLRENLLAQYQQHALRLAKGVLECLADTDGQQMIVDAFVRRLRERAFETSTDEPAREGPRTTQSVGGSVLVRSAFELSPQHQEAIREGLTSSGVRKQDIQFKVDESLIIGIELRTSDHEVSWNARESLDWLASEFARELDTLLAMPEALRQNGQIDPEVSHAP